MTEIQLRDFAPHLPTEQAEEMANTLAVSYQDFARRSSYFARLYGVLTGSDEGDKDAETFIVNACLRRALASSLFQVQTMTENQIKYNLSTRYHVEELPWLEEGKFRTRWPGVVGMNVKRAWYSIDSCEKLLISPYIEENVYVSPDTEFPTVEVDASVVLDPDEVILREVDTNRKLHYLTSPDDRPYRQDGMWVYKIDTQKSTWTAGTEINAQHKQLVYIDLPPTTIPTGGVAEFVYPGTNQIIAQAKTSESLDNGDTRYWFFNYTLVRPEFTERVVNFEQAEFYKLYEYISLKYWIEETIVAEILVGEGNDQQTFTFDPTDTTNPQPFTIVMASGQHGIYHINYDMYDFAKVADVVPDFSTIDPTTIKVKVYYKTDPTALPAKYQNQVPQIMDAMMYKIAAELPVDDCGCETKRGFIFAQQRAYADSYSNPFTGTEITRFNYGDLHGQVRYAEVMGSILHYPRVLRMSHKG